MFKTIGGKITLTFVSFSTIGLISLVLFYTDSQEKQIIEQNETSMIKVTESVSEGLQAVMIGGYADIAQSYASNLQKVPGIIDFRILRTDGSEAFLDNGTINNVNERKDEELFFPRDRETLRQLLPPDHLELRLAVSDQKTSKYYTIDENGQRILTFLTPIKNNKDCYDCHGSRDPVRGVLKLTMSLAEVDAQISATRKKALQIGVVVVIFLFTITFIMVRRTVVYPMSQITEAMRKVSGGDLKQKVPEFSSKELKAMASSFNQMSSELMSTYQGLKEEHDKITTLILSTQEGMVVTDRHGRIVLTNPAAELILGKTKDEIIMTGFLHLVDDPEVVRSQLNRIDTDDQRPAQFEYHGLTLRLSASTIRSNENEPIGTAALIRDVTEEVRLNKELEHLSTSDGLTGLYNRRYLDAKLTEELSRVGRYCSDLSIFLFDVDHFKKFNDTHGHDQGDRVLQSLAETVKESLRAIDIPCRYGGEEFLVILPETDLEGARVIAERVRESIEKTLVDGLSVTVSIGVASTGRGTVTDLLQFIQMADKALYMGKEAGRNVVICAPDPQTDSPITEETP